MPLLSVYNHLMQGYVMMRQTRFDSHKKSELRDIYQNIMRLSSEQPLYKISFDESAQAYTIGIKNHALSLSSIVKELHIDDGTSVFQSKLPASDTPEAVSVSVSEGADTSRLSLPLEVEVSALASPQKNEGSFMHASKAELPSYQYTFTIGIEKNLYSFQFNVADGSTNLELQAKLSDFINKTNVGLRTNVVHRKEADLSKLVLTAALPGSAVSGENSFRLTDTRYPANADYGIITHFNLDNMTEAPQNTAFTINGKPYETRGTDFLYKNVLALSFSRPTDTPATISAVTDKAPVIQKLNSFLDGYNSMLDFVRLNGAGHRRSGKLLADLSNVSRRYREDLAAVGISISKDGALVMDLDTAYPSAENGSMEDFFQSEGGFVSSFLNKLSGISINPMDYLDKIVVTYPNHAARKTYSPYTASIYSGLLYNNYC